MDNDSIVERTLGDEQMSIEFELVNKIKKAAIAYYTGQSIMTDKEFDQLIDELKLINKDNPILKIPGWGYNPVGEKVSHPYGLVGSLSKYRDVYDARSHFLMKNKIWGMPKYDGISCVAYYKNGVLDKAVTRGNGYEGLDVTDKFIKVNGESCLILDDPTMIFSSGNFGIRGEFIISNTNWISLKEKSPEYKNSRNAVAGLINQKGLSELLDYVSFIPYKMIGKSNELTECTSFADMIYYLESRWKHNTAKASFLSYVPEYSELYSLIDNYDYPCDGVVLTDGTLLTDNEFVEFDQVAFKFEDEKVESKVINIDWNMTRTGKLIPTAEIEPVELDGATIKRVTCFNAQYVKDNRIDKGAVVEIQRSGEVIPDIQRVVEESPNFSLPTVCPSCGHELVWNGVNLVCNNDECDSKSYEKLYRWISVVLCNGVDGVGPALIDIFINCFKCKTVEELNNLIRHSDYTVYFDGLTNNMMSKFFKMVDNVIEEVDPVRFLVGLNIEGLGWTMSEAIGSNKDLMDSILKESDMDFLYTKIKLVNGIGSSLASTIINHIDRIRSVANSFDNEFTKVVNLKVNEEKKKVTVTGALSISRSEFNSLINKYGYEVDSNIKNSEYLVTNDPNPSSSKGRKAKELGKEIITEEEFYRIIGIK